MKALTVRQPWASLIACGVKTIETRSRVTHHRGPITIHAGMSQSAIGIDFWQFHGQRAATPIYTALSEAGLGITPYSDLPLGAVLAVAEVVDCVPSDPTMWTARTGGPFSGSTRMGDGTDAHFYWSDGQGPRPHYDWDAQAPYCDFENNGWAWLLADVRPLPEPVPCRGAQGLWQLPADVEAAVTAQLAEAVAS